MVKLIPSLKSIGIEKKGEQLFVAELVIHRGKVKINDLASLTLVENSVPKRLIAKHPIITTVVPGHAVLSRLLYLPLTKEKDVEDALVFQAEPLLPYPIDQALLTKLILSQSTEGTSLLAFALKKEALEKHLEEWRQWKIEPERVSSVQVALFCFAKFAISSDQTAILVDIQEKSTTAILFQKGKLLQSFALQEGYHLLSHAFQEDIQASENSEMKQITLEELDFSHLDNEFPLLKLALAKLKQLVSKVSLALMKESKLVNVEGLLLTGPLQSKKGIVQKISEGISLPIHLNEQLLEESSYSEQEILTYAVPIGLALNSLPNQSTGIDFRQAEYAYPKPWKRSLFSLILYFILIALLSACLYLWSAFSLLSKETQVKQNYRDLLSGIGKTYEEFEKNYQAKNPGEKPIGIEEISEQALEDRLNFMQRELQAVPDSFPLFANTPRVSDVLAWLSTHSAVVGDTADNSGKLFLENFSYHLVKRPEFGKKQEKYQVKIELEFSTSIPKLAREFHDALIAPNDFIDPKAEIKWSASRNLYKTSFYLKDKTAYL